MYVHASQYVYGTGASAEAADTAGSTPRMTREAGAAPASTMAAAVPESRRSSWRLKFHDIGGWAARAGYGLDGYLGIEYPYLGIGWQNMGSYFFLVSNKYEYDVGVVFFCQNIHIDGFWVFFLKMGMLLEML